MTEATIYPDGFPIAFALDIYPAWLLDRLREQGIRFLPGLPALGFSAKDVQAHIAPPWTADRRFDGSIVVWQGESTDHPPAPAP